MLTQLFDQFINHLIVYLFSALGIIAAVIVICNWIVRMVCALLDGRTKRIEERVRKQLLAEESNRLISAAWWFSEDPATMNLVRGLAERKCASILREHWHKERAK